MRDRKPQALRRERQTADGRRHLEGFFLGLAAADERGLAGRPRHRAIGMKRDIVDPAPLGIGRQQRDLAFGVRARRACRHRRPSRCARRRRPRTGCRRHGRRPARSRPAPLTSATLSSAPTKAACIAEEMHRDDRHADRERTHPIGDRNDGGGLLARIELFHHVVIQLSKPSRIVCSGNSRPMKTRRLSRASPSFQAR